MTKCFHRQIVKYFLHWILVSKYLSTPQCALNNKNRSTDRRETTITDSDSSMINLNLLETMMSRLDRLFSSVSHFFLRTWTEYKSALWMKWTTLQWRGTIINDLKLAPE